MGHIMQFLKDFLRNLLLLIVIVLILFIVFPDMMSQVFQVYGALLGPAAVLVIIVAALPRRKRSRH